jgi:hypothetical protein
MLNISPIGRNCSREERNDYEKFDIANNIRKKMVEAMRKEFSDLDMTYSIGGQISFDCFPTGWDKTYCLNFLDAKDFDEIRKSFLCQRKAAGMRDLYLPGFDGFFLLFQTFLATKHLKEEMTSKSLLVNEPSDTLYLLQMTLRYAFL